MIGVTASLGVALSCTSSSVFICTHDTDCGDGRCEPDGYCSFQSGNCSTGWAYGEFAPSHLAGMCVGPASTGDTEPADTDPTTSSEPPERPTTSEVTTAPTTSGADSSTSYSYAESTYGYETGAIPDACILYGSLVAECLGEDDGQQIYEDCIYAYTRYYDYGEYCAYAFNDYLVCLSSLPCRELGDPAGLCEVEGIIFERACLMPMPAPTEPGERG